MSTALRVVCIGLFVLASGCTKDPWSELKPRQMLETAEGMFLKGDPRAGEALTAALDKAVRADISVVDMRAYAMPLFQFHALHGELGKAELLFDRINRPEENVYVYPHIANNLAILYANALRGDDARRVMAKTLRSIEGTSATSSDDQGNSRLVFLANIDRISLSMGDARMSARAHAGVIAHLRDLSQFRMGRHWPLAPGVKPFLDRHVAILHRAGRTADADAIESLATAIERAAPSEAVEGECIARVRWSRTWCILEAT